MTIPLEVVLINLHRQNPLVALTQAREPEISADSALLVAMEIRDLYAGGISVLGRFAAAALEELGDNPTEESALKIATAFMRDVVEEGPESSAVAFLAVYTELDERMRRLIDPSTFDVAELRKLMNDFVAMKHGGPAAE